MSTFKKLLVTAASVWFISATYAQRTQVYVSPEAVYKEGLDLFQKEKYAAAQPKFEEFLKLKAEKAPGTRAYADYLSAVCAVELFHEDAEPRMLRFLSTYPESPLIISARFQLGKLKFRQKKFKEAIQYFKETEPDQLSREEWYEYKYKLGYSYFMTGKFNEALPNFREIKDTKNVYAVPATYYYAHINYLNKKYDEALVHFRKIEKEKAFSGLIPYYVVQIYYFQKKYDEVISYGKTIADTAKGKSVVPVYRLLAESYYIKEDYNASILNYNRFLTAGQNLDREGNYKLARAYYNTKKYAEAADRFAALTGVNDSLAQNSWYTLADCYMKLNKERNALDAFKMAYKTDVDKALAEDALFNFAKLSFKIDFDPYNEAIKALREYLDTYPNSPKAKEAYGFLAEVFMTTRNYKDALQVLDKIKKNDRRLEDAYRRVAYFHAQDLFNAGQYDEALKMYNLSAKPGWNNALSAGSIFWQGEIFYRRNQLPEAAEAYQEFLVTPGALESGLLNEAYYNLGYVRFKQKNYPKAATEFRKYIDNAKKEKDGKRKADACLRAGDCYYIQKDWNQALTYYNKAIETSSFDADYGLLQKGIIQGVLKQNNQKLSTLRQLEKEYPKSPYMAEALFEIGNTLFLDGKNEEGIATMQRVVNQYSGSSFHKKALLKIGLDYFNREKDEQALSYFKQVLEKYPGTPEANDALKYVRVIYVDAGKADDLVDFLRNIKGVDFNESALDSTFYTSAENLVIKGDCDKAVADFTKYLQKYPNGAFVINARYYRGECNFQKQQWDESLEDFLFVANAPLNNFTENALLRSGGIYFTKRQFAEAIQAYEKAEKVTELKDNILLIRLRLVESYAQTQANDKTIEYADMLLKEEKVTGIEKERIYLLLGKAYLNKNETENALTWLKKAADSKKTEASAEATHIECKIMFERGQYTQCEKRILATVNDMVSYYDWLAKNFILLSDVYMKLDNIDQAIATLQSVIDNHDVPETVNLARQKLEEAEAEQRRRNTKPDFNDFEFDSPGGN
ncbi:MAG: tetratricopeptide repeat protein [Flavobacteriales bacterium]|nr:tetratricopeptide repeat protein [Flavobacteriales bacterium]